jgi:ketosteroid isomerase-like protein
MKAALVILSTIAIAGACSSAMPAARNANSDVTENSLMQADRDFAAATHSRGIEGWMSFYARDAIRIRYLDNMVKGYDEVRKFDLPNISDTTVVLNWEPTDAYVYQDEMTGSTTGRYWIVSRRTTDAGKELGRGRYVTMWRREQGRWLVIMDTGYPQPPATTR